HAGQLVSKEALLNAVWPQTYVSDVVLMVCIRELRRALGDDAKQPRYIETVHRRGYRFIAAATTQTDEPAPHFERTEDPPGPLPPSAHFLCHHSFRATSPDAPA